MAPKHEESDATLVAFARGGDLEAFGTLVRRYQNMVLATSYARLGTLEDARDVAQEALLASFENLSRLRSGPKFSSWLRGISCLSGNEEARGCIDGTGRQDTSETSD